MSSTDSFPASSRGWHGKVLALTWPTLLANITIPLVGIVDTAVMGQLTDPAYIGAIAVGSSILTAFYWLFGFLRMGTTGLTAQAYGAADGAQAVATALRAAAIALLLGTTLVALQLPISYVALQVFEASSEVEQWAERYFLIRIWGAPALLVQMVALGVLFGMQRMRSALWVSLTMNATNITLDLLFVLVFDWGVTGVASATLIAEWLAACSAVLFVLRALRDQGWLPRRQGLAEQMQGVWQRAALHRFFSISGNLVVRTFFVQLPFFVVTLLGAALGDVLLAANAILMQIFMLTAFGLDAFAHTAETLAGQAYGANHKEHLRRASGYSTLWGGVLAVGLAALIALAGPPFIAILSESAQVREAALAYLPWMVLNPLLGIWAFLGDGIFIGTTQIKALRNSMFAASMVFLLALWLTFDAFGNHAIWLSFTLFMLVRATLLAALYPRLERSISSAHPST